MGSSLLCINTSESPPQTGAEYDKILWYTKQSRQIYLNDGVFAGGVYFEIVRHLPAPALHSDEAVLPGLGLDDVQHGAVGIGNYYPVIFQG